MEELLPFVTPVTFGRRKIRKSCLISTQVLPARRFTKPLHNSSSDSSNFSKLNKTVFKIQNVKNKKLCPQSRSLSISFTHLLLLFNLCSLAETTFCHKQKRGKFSLIVYQKNTKLSSSKFTLCLDFGASKYHHNLFLWIQNSAANITLELTLGGFKPWQKTMKPLLVPFSSKTRWENDLQTTETTHLEIYVPTFLIYTLQLKCQRRSWTWGRSGASPTSQAATGRLVLHGCKSIDLMDCMFSLQKNMVTLCVYVYA